MEVDSHPNNFLAFRSSCDRCRYMKLKCPSNGTESHEPCERCSRAKLPCKYSRRTNSSRRSATRQDDTLDLAESHDHMSAPEDQASAQCDGSPNPNNERIPEVRPESDYPFCYPSALDVVGTELPWMEWDIPSTESAATLWPTPPTGFSEQLEATSAQCMLSLANLAVEIGECLQLVRSDIRTQSIDDYPIGHIRHVCQAFVASSQNRSLSATDMWSTLLLLRCYVSLRKIYISAFTNIQDHLPLENEMQTQLSHAQDQRNMRLRGMDILSERYMRSYTAFNITLDLLHNCDAALELCAICRPLDQSTSPSPLASMQNSQCVRPDDNLGAALEKPSNACIACALPATLRKEAVSIFSAIADQEHTLHEVVALLRGTLRQRMGLT